MSNENENIDTIEEKRRKNIIDNQKFLENLKLFNVRDDLKFTVNSVTKVDKSLQKKRIQKEKIDPSEVRRSSRIQSMHQIDYNNQSVPDEDIILSSDDTSSDEEDDLSSAFITKNDKDWHPIHPEKILTKKSIRPIRKVAKTISGGVKIFMPNIGLQASKVISKDTSHNKYSGIKKINVAISSSSEED